MGGISSGDLPLKGGGLNQQDKNDLMFQLKANCIWFLRIIKFYKVNNNGLFFVRLKHHLGNKIRTSGVSVVLNKLIHKDPSVDNT